MGAAEVVILASVSKRYFRKPGIRSIAAELRGTDAPGGFWALHDVNLTVSRGERVGVVGANGAGKTTLLRLLSGVITPTRGERRASGRVLALSEMQACLHRELTGRENIPLLAALAGLSLREVEARLDDVLAFSGLPKGALDTPVKNYSEGMAARLAISIAVTGEADLIVVDEGIAGGDATFRRQCFDRLRERASQGCAVVLASHDARDVRTHCDRCLHLRQGCVVADGRPDEVLTEYRREQWSAGLSEPAGVTSGPAPLTVDLRLGLRGEGTPPAANRALEIEMRYETPNAVEGVVFGVEIVAADGATVFLFQSPVGTDAWRLGPGPGTATLLIPDIGLAPGAYEANVDAWDQSQNRLLVRQPGPVFVVSGARDARSGPVLPPVHEWARR